MPTTQREYYNVREAAAYCGMTWHMFRYYLNSGRIVPDYHAQNRLNLFKQSTLDAFNATPKNPPWRPKKPAPAEPVVKRKPGRPRKVQAQEEKA